VIDLFKSKYHDYHKALYNTENVKSIGVYGDNPIDKFTNTTQTFNQKQLFYNDNHQVGFGTTKTTTHIPGYSGFIPRNKQKVQFCNEKDSYVSNNKANHMINYNTRLPGYKGYLSKNPENIKGVSRPFCLSTKGEMFN
jgi:hypothetical protein